ncbi:alaserpin-like isoform X3 [Tenebrio molitor]|uniref:alaserpin-like isoform X3 n=1 Tax=Tenebrio molitor TaxID=7067 RepID=UPI0036247269
MEDMTDVDVTKEFVEANNSFLPSIYKEIVKEEKGNVLMSPLSAETILALTHSGCRGETAEELRIALHLPDDPAKIQSAVKAVLSDLKTNEGCKLFIANKMYIKKDFSINDEFQKTANTVYFGDSENIDFTMNERAAETINSWVEKVTENKIKNLIQSQVLNNLTRVILVNALYFKGAWYQKFSLTGTKKIKFYKSKNEVVKVDAMTSEPSKNYTICICKELNAKLLELPMHGDASMVIVLPDKRHGLADLESKIDKVFFPYRFYSTEVKVLLPKFKIEHQIDFSAVLQNLGVRRIFSEDDADLSGIAGEKGDLVVNAVLQKTFIDVSEEGVEAASATNVAISVFYSSAKKRREKFIADHPFIFYLKVKNVIIFAGRVIEPCY